MPCSLLFPFLVGTQLFSIVIANLVPRHDELLSLQVPAEVDGPINDYIRLPIDSEILAPGASVPVKLGTPKVNLTLFIDFTNSDPWVEPTCTSLGLQTPRRNDTLRARPPPCPRELNSTYDPGRSVTAASLSEQSSIEFRADEYEGEYVSDTISLAGWDLQTNFLVTSEKALGVGWPLSQGGLGLGPLRDGIIQYGLLQQLYRSRLIASQAFTMHLSVYSNPSFSAQLNHPYGGLVFGGIDTRKYTGRLHELEYETERNDIRRYWFNMSQITHHSPSSSIPHTFAYDIPVYADTSSYPLSLPSTAAYALLAYFPDAEPFADGFYTVSCSWREQTGKLDLFFGQLRVRLAYEDLVLGPEVHILVPGSCVLGVRVTDEKFGVLGTSILQKVLFAVDQNQSSVFLAERADCGEEIVPFTEETRDRWENGTCLATSDDVIQPVGLPNNSGEDESHGDQHGDDEWETSAADALLPTSTTSLCEDEGHAHSSVQQDAGVASWTVDADSSTADPSEETTTEYWVVSFPVPFIKPSAEPTTEPMAEATPDSLVEPLIESTLEVLTGSGMGATETTSEYLTDTTTTTSTSTGPVLTVGTPSQWPGLDNTTTIVLQSSDTESVTEFPGPSASSSRGERVTTRFETIFTTITMKCEPGEDGRNCTRL